MIQNVLQEISGIGLYGVISVCLFFCVFSVALAYACQLKKPFLKSMGALPLDDELSPPSVAGTVSPRVVSSERSPAARTSLGRTSADEPARATLLAETKGVTRNE